MLPPFEPTAERFGLDHQERDRPLTFHWKSKADLIESLGLPSPKSKDRGAARNSMITEAVLAHDEDRWVSYSRRKEHYTDLGRYHGTAYTYTIVTSVIEDLLAADLIVEERTLPGHRGWQSRFRATLGLIEALAEAQFDYQLEGLIRLKNEAGDLVDYKDTDATRRMHRAMVEINEFLATIDLQLNAHDIVRTRCHLQIDGASYRPSVPALYRVFNRYSFQFGGRAYGWWQSLPKARRQQLLINGEPVAEPDFAQLHPSMLYARRGLRLDIDPYDTGVFPRDDGKLAFNVVLNARTLQGALSALRNKANWPYSTKQTSKLINLLKQINAPIAADLHADQGVRLMQADSKIILDAVKACAKAGIPALPIHDSMLTPARYESRVAEIMEASAAHHLKRPKPCTVRVSGDLVPHMPSPSSSLPSFSSPVAAPKPAASGRAQTSRPVPIQLELFEEITMADPLAFGRQNQKPHRPKKAA